MKTGHKWGRVLFLLAMVLLFCRAGTAADSVQWQSTTQEKIVHPYKVGFYMRTHPDSPIEIDTTGLADTAHQETANTLLDAINTKIPASPSDSTRQDTGNEYLAEIADNTDPETVNAIKTAVEAVNTALQAGGVTQAQLDAVKTALEILDNIVSGSEAQVDVVSSALPTGAATETTLAGVALESGGNLAAIATDIAAIEARLDDMTQSDSCTTDRVDFNPYSGVQKSYSNVAKVDIYLETASRKLRVATDGNDTDGQYFVVDKSESPGWTTGAGLRYPTWNCELKSDTEGESGVAVIRAYHYGD